jgi:acyl carrier protein
MLTEEAVREIVVREILEVLLEDGEDHEPLAGHELLHDLSINSITLARVLVQLESEIGVDPFGGGDAAIADMQSVADLVGAYQRARAKAEAGATA